MRFKRPKQKAPKFFDDALLNQILAKLAWLGSEPVAEGSTGEERERRHEFVVHVAREVAVGFGTMPAIKRALHFTYPDRTDDQLLGAFVELVAVLFMLDPEDFFRHLHARKEALQLEVHKPTVN